MKERISITIEKDIADKLNSLIKDRKFRNRSHAVEMAIEQLNKSEEEKSRKEKK